MATGDLGSFECNLTSFLHEETHLFNWETLRRIGGRCQGWWAGEFSCIYFQERAGFYRNGVDIRRQVLRWFPQEPRHQLTQLSRIADKEGHSDELFHEAFAFLYFLEERFGPQRLLEFRTRMLQVAASGSEREDPGEALLQTYERTPSELEAKCAGFFEWCLL